MSAYLLTLLFLLLGGGTTTTAFQQPQSLLRSNSIFNNNNSFLTTKVTSKTATTCSTTRSKISSTKLSAEESSSINDTRPQVFATGYSTNPTSLTTAIEEATTAALASLPTATDLQYKIDLAIVSTSSLYDEPMSSIVPNIIKVIEASSGLYGYTGLNHLVGCTAGGVIGSRATTANASSESPSDDNKRECSPYEAEASPAISVTLALLPNVDITTFHVDGEDVPEFDGGLFQQEFGGSDGTEVWKRLVGLGSSSNDDDASDKDSTDPIFMMIPSPAFQNNLDDFLSGLQYAYPNGQTFGGIASTVSSLSRARLFCYSDGGNNSGNVHGNGCVGVSFKGDIQVDTMISQGAKPVGGVYRVVATGRNGPGGRGMTTAEEDEAGRSTIGAIVLDEAATAEEEQMMEEEEEDENDEPMDEKEAKQASLAAEYAKSRIPKPPLAEANFVMRRLSDDDQAFMRRALLIGLERGGSLVGRTPNELARLAKGEGHRFTVRQVASAGMKDGSVTFPLGSVDIDIGARCRFFVRDGEFAKKEAKALWMGYKKKELEGSLFGGMESDDEESPSLNPPTGCLVLPTLDRGVKLYGGKPGYESGLVSEFLPNVPSISGFFANGVLGKLDGTIAGNVGVSNENMLHGSSSQYVVFRSKTKRPIYSPYKAQQDVINAAAAKAEADAADQELAAEDEKRSKMSKSSFGSDEAAPRSENGELIVKRREVHSGRALSVSTVEWSVAEKTAKPTSALEGYMWEKETQVDRLRERTPLALLMTNCKAAMSDPTKPRPRDWIGPVKQAGSNGKFVIIPECKRMEPATGSLRKRFDVSKLVKQLTVAGASAISVNSDGVLFGGTMEDITTAREASNAAAVTQSLDSGDGVVAPPILASDLLLYPYQLYKFRLAGADAVNLVVGALESKDLLYLTKIATTIQLQVLASVTSEVQIEMLTKLGPGSIHALVLSNRELETFDFDGSGEQALSLLKSEALKAFREKHGSDVPILVEGRVGLIERDGDNAGYIKALKENGAFGAIIGGGIAAINDDSVAQSLTSWAM
uniref:indole-3-glycerol-phosphate synthase n=1 Tax=Skeletonema marinoi TaxID=267567 RepID=A0A7S2LEG4_9STRA|mmetsp:Transcript_23870/g.40634  ORF Transcript_23870/g.40634 Transcript_23870/m.40634 type:complete len:1041 (+) Transcript_23870:139-3261(+)